MDWRVVWHGIDIYFTSILSGVGSGKAAPVKGCTAVGAMGRGVARVAGLSNERTAAGIQAWMEIVEHEILLVAF